MKKITIIETESHGGGVICVDGVVDTYYYDDGYLGNVANTLNALVDMGAIPADDIEIFTLEEAVRALNNLQVPRKVGAHELEDSGRATGEHYAKAT